MGKPEQYTAQQMIDALIAKKGMKTIAARYLGCDYKTLQRYIEKYPTVHQAWAESQEVTGDQVETVLLNQALGVLNDNGVGWKQEPNVSALIFLAKVHPAMRKRGYGEKRFSEQEGEIKVRVIYDDYNPKTS